MEEQGGGPQEMAVVRGAAGGFQAERRGRAGAGQAPPPEASLWATCPTLEISGQVPRVPGGVSVELHAGPATQRTGRFPVAQAS